MKSKLPTQSVSAPNTMNQTPARPVQNVVTQNSFGSMISPNMFPTQLQRNVSQPTPSTTNTTASATSTTSTSTTTLNQAAKPFTPSAKPLSQGLVYSSQPYAKATGMNNFMPPDLEVNNYQQNMPSHMPKGNISGHNNTTMYAHTPPAAALGGDIYSGSTFPNFGSQKGLMYPNFINSNIPLSTPPYYNNMPSVLSRQQTN